MNDSAAVAIERPTGLWSGLVRRGYSLLLSLMVTGWLGLVLAAVVGPNNAEIIAGAVLGLSLWLLAPYVFLLLVLALRAFNAGVRRFWLRLARNSLLVGAGAVAGVAAAIALHSMMVVTVHNRSTVPLACLTFSSGAPFGTCRTLDVGASSRFFLWPKTERALVLSFKTPRGQRQITVDGYVVPPRRIDVTIDGDHATINDKTRVVGDCTHPNDHCPTGR